MKKLIESLLGITILLALVIGGAQTASGGPVLSITLPCLAIIALCGFGLRALENNKSQSETGHENEIIK